MDPKTGDELPPSQPITNESIDQLLTSGRQELLRLVDLEDLEQWRLRYLGRSGALTIALRGLSSLPVDQRRVIGAAGNTARKSLEEAYDATLSALQESNSGMHLHRSIDVTMPGRQPSLGRLHPNYSNSPGNYSGIFLNGLSGA